MKHILKFIKQISEVNMSEGKPVRVISVFAVPLIIGNLFQLFYTMVDTAVVGKYVGVDALASVGATTPVVELLIGLLIGMANGISIVVTQKIGADDKKETGKAMVNGFYLLMGLTVLITIVGLIFLRPLFRLINVEEHLIDGAMLYARILIGGGVFTALYNYESALFRAHGNSVAPLIFLILSSVLNIIMDILFVKYLHMGIAGVALATILAQVICVVLCFFAMKRLKGILPRKDTSFLPDKQSIMEHIRVGMPMAFFQSLLAVSFLVMQSALNALGTNEVAAYTAAYKMDSLTMTVLSGFGTAISTFAAHNFGRRDYGRIRKGIGQTLAVTITISLVVFILGQLFAEPFMKLFVGSDETEVIALGVSYIHFTSKLYWVLGINFIVRFVLTGVGQAAVPLGVGALEIINRVAGTFLLIVPFGFKGMIYINPLCWVTSTFLVAVFLPVLLNRAIKKQEARYKTAF